MFTLAVSSGKVRQHVLLGLADFPELHWMHPSLFDMDCDSFDIGSRALCIVSYSWSKL